MDAHTKRIRNIIKREVRKTFRNQDEEVVSKAFNLVWKEMAYANDVFVDKNGTIVERGIQNYDTKRTL